MRLWSSRVVKDKYIFCYLLGSNPQHREWAEELKKHTGYKIVTIPFLDEFVESDITFGDCQLFDVGPAEFMNLIRYAEYVCTDSFHQHYNSDVTVDLAMKLAEVLVNE